MVINYCDLCGSVLKDNNFYSLCAIEPRPTKFNNVEDYSKYLYNINTSTKDICPSCKHIFDKIFELRLQRLSELSEEINNIYKISHKKAKNNE